jgi:hypothetical protein
MVHLSPGSSSAANARADTTVTGVSGPTKEGLYVVRVELPEGTRERGKARPGQENNDGQISGTLVTKRIRLLAKLFGVFRNITRGS